MKISFYQQNLSGTEKTQSEKNHVECGKKTAAAAVAPGAVYSEGVQDWGGTGKAGKGKSLIEIQQEADRTNVDVQQDYMTLMSHTMSEEDYAKLQEEGFDFRSMDPEKAVTIVDRIKAELVRAGKDIKGYTDDLDVETLAAALGSQTLADALVDSFGAADLPLTRENLDLALRAWNMAVELQPMDEGSSRYLIDNEMEGEIWNLYLAQNSGSGAAGGNAPRFYEEEVQGYYAYNADLEQSEELAEQVDRLIAQSGREVNEESRRNAAWLLENGLPLTNENLDRLEKLGEIPLPVTEEEFARAAADAISEGKDPVHAKLGGKRENLYDKAARLAEYYHSDEAWERFAGDVTARRQLEEIRLRMTAEVNIKLLKSGFSIDTAPMEELVEALKQAERELAEQYFPGDEEAVEKYRCCQTVDRVVAELPGLPAQVLGVFAEGQPAATLEEFHSQGTEIKERYDQARESYETLMTAPRADLGDSIRKAFANVDDILRDLGLEPNEENRRAVRILGYNRMPTTQENVERVMEADRQVKAVVEKMTPGATLKMIRDGVNPLEKNFSELERYFEELPEEYRREAESYSRFLYRMEQNRAITDAERESYIGVYRLIRQIERSDGAVVGALVNAQAELHFSNLLAAVRSGKVKSIDVKVADELGTVAELLRKGESISDQIEKAFVRRTDEVLTEVSQNEEAERAYQREELEELREAVANADSQSVTMLQRGQLAPGADNLMAAQALANGRENLFAAGRGISRRRGGGSAEGKTTEVSHAEKEGAHVSGSDGTAADPPETSDGRAEEASASGEMAGGALWEVLDDRETFVREYENLTEETQKAVEEASIQQADTSLDVRGLQLVHKQLTVAAALARQEEYFLPVYIGETLTRVHLILERGDSRKGQVSVGVQVSDEFCLNARFQLENGVLNGIFTARDQNEVMKLQELADTFREEAGDTWKIGRIAISSDPAADADIEASEVRSADNAELYRVAKVFLQAVQKRGI